jgi:hypothetical protein
MLGPEVAMPRIGTLVVLFLILVSSAAAKDKKKSPLPAPVLKAETVLVVIDPDAGVSPTDPMANKTAQEDVEKAFMKWGRLTPVLSGQTADLIVTVRKGTGKIVQPTITNGRVNDRPVIAQSTDKSVRIGGQRGQDPTTAPATPPDTSPHPQVEVGEAEDTFVVYLGHIEDPLNRPAVWRYIAKDALRSPKVPAVAEFRKLIEEAEKQQKPKP